MIRAWTAVASWVLFVSGCGGVQGPDYRGEPLATVQGRMSASDKVDTSRGVRLAVAWYPSLGSDEAPLVQPRSIVTQDLIYRGSFPLNYAFDLFQPPPREALGVATTDSDSASAAFGVLLAYVDENGNGRLDTIPVGGEPIDTLLGSSWEFIGLNGYGLMYLDRATPLVDNSGGWTIQPGFNLVDATHVLPFSTQVPIPLTGSSDLNLYVCDELWGNSTTTGGTTCRLKPPESAKLGASLELDGQRAMVHVSLFDFDKNEPTSGAHVTMNGTALTEEAPGLYALFDDTGTVLQPGASYLIRAEPADGSAPMEQTAVMPGEFAITSPADNASLPNGSAVEVAWTRSANADFYKVWMEEDPSGSWILDERRTETEQFTTEPISYSGKALVKVRAVRGDGFTSAYTAVIRSVPVTFVE